MIVRCAWCKRIQGVKRPFFNCSVTHGICKGCSLKEIEKSLRDSKLKGLVLSKLRNKKARCVAKRNGLKNHKRSDSNVNDSKYISELKVC